MTNKFFAPTQTTSNEKQDSFSSTHKNQCCTYYRCRAQYGARRIQALELAFTTLKREATGYELTLGMALVPRVEQMEQAFLQIENRINLCKVVCELAHLRVLELHF